MDDPILDSTILSTDEGSFLQQLNHLYPDIRQKFLTSVKLLRLGHRIPDDLEHWNAVTANSTGLTVFVSLSMLKWYEYKSVLAFDAQDVTLPDIVPTLDELFERAKDVFMRSVETQGDLIHGSGVFTGVRYVFQLKGSSRICFMILGLCHDDTLLPFQDSPKNVFYANYDHEAAKASAVNKLGDGIKDQVMGPRREG